MGAAAQHDEPIDLARFAEVMAHLRHFAEAPGDEVLARLGLGKAAWEAAEARWYAARDAELANGKTELTRRFGRLFARAQRDLAKRRPSLDSLGPAATSEVEARPVAKAPSAPPPAPSPSPSPFASPSPSLPEPPAVVPHVHRLAGTAALGVEIPRQALPFAPGPAAPPPPSARVDERPPPLSRLGETVAVSRDALKQSTPFLRRPAAPAARADETVGLAPGAGGTPPLPAGVPDLTLQQYASLRVELTTRPEDANGVLARYGLRLDTRDALDAYWRARFEADPLLRMEFVRAYATYLSWLREQRGQ